MKNIIIASIFITLILAVSFLYTYYQPLSCDEQYSKLLNEYKLSSYGWNNQQDYISSTFHKSAMLNKLKKECEGWQ